MMHIQSLRTTLSAVLQKSYGQLHSFQILSIFLYDFCVGFWQAHLGSTHKAYLKNNEYMRHMYIIISYDYYNWKI